MASRGREIRRIAFACDTLLRRVHRSEMDVRRKFSLECETVHTGPNLFK